MSLLKKSLSLPSKRYITLKKLIELNEEQRETFIKELKKFEPYITEIEDKRIEDKRIKEISRKLNIKEGSAQEMLDFIFELHFVLYDKLNQDIDGFLNVLKKSIEISEEEKISKYILDCWENFANFLRKILSIENITIIAKYTIIRADHKNVYQSGRLLTDIRPIFMSDLSVQANAATIYHNLKIDYFLHGSDKKKSIYLALDKNDLIELRSIIDRALNKEKNLERLFENKDLKLIKNSEED